MMDGEAAHPPHHPSRLPHPMKQLPIRFKTLA